jgi:hypothetical protein
VLCRAAGGGEIEWRGRKIPFVPYGVRKPDGQMTWNAAKNDSVAISATAGTAAGINGFDKL